MDIHAAFARHPNLWRIADRGLARRGPQGDGERRLEARFVKAWEDPAAIDRFQLGPSIPLVGNLDPEQPGRGSLERRAVGEAEGDGASRHRLGEGQPTSTGCVHLPPAGRQHLAASQDLDRLDRQVAPVQVDRPAGFLQRRIDFGLAREAFLRRVDRQVEPIGLRLHLSGQFACRNRRRFSPHRRGQCLAPGRGIDRKSQSGRGSKFPVHQDPHPDEYLPAPARQGASAGAEFDRRDTAIDGSLAQQPTQQAARKSAQHRPAQRRADRTGGGRGGRGHR